MLLDLVDARQGQPSLFERTDPKDGQLIEAMDVIERRMGRGCHSLRSQRDCGPVATQRRIPVATLYDPLGRIFLS